MELIFTWVIKAEHTGAFPGNPSFAWIEKNNKNCTGTRHPGSQNQEFIPTTIEKCVKLSFQSLRKPRNQEQNISIFFWTSCRGSLPYNYLIHQNNWNKVFHKKYLIILRANILIKVYIAGKVSCISLNLVPCLKTLAVSNDIDW